MSSTRWPNCRIRRRGYNGFIRRLSSRMMCEAGRREANGSSETNAMAATQQRATDSWRVRSIKVRRGRVWAGSRLACVQLVSGT